MEYYILCGKDAPKSPMVVSPKSIESPLYEPTSEMLKTLEIPDVLELNICVFKRSGDFDLSRDLSLVEDIWYDYMPSNYVRHLLSERMKIIIDSLLTGQEGIRWLKVKVRANTEVRFYFIPFYENQLDVLDAEQTLYYVGSGNIRVITRPVFDLNKIKNYSVFHGPHQSSWRMFSSLYVNKIIKEALMKQKIKGLAFEKVRV